MSTEEAEWHLMPLPMEPIARQHLIGNTILAAIATIIVGLRFYARHFSIGYGLDDLFIAISWPFSVALLAESGFLSTIGLGYDFDMKADYFPTLFNNFQPFMKVILSFQLLYMMSLTFVKCSVLLFYRRIFVNEQMKKLVAATIVFVVVWCIAHCFAMIFICHPVAAWWDAEAGTCLNQIPIYVSLIITNIVSDIAIMCLPMVSIWELKMKRTEKLALTAAFALGIASVGVAIWRLVTVFAINMADNITGTLELAVFLCTLETILALLCVNIPLLRPLYRRFIARHSSSKIEETNRGYAAEYAGRTGAGKSHSGEVELDNYSKGRGFERSVYVEEGSFDGDSSSEKRLNTFAKPSNTKNDIVVKTEWTIERHH